MPESVAGGRQVATMPKLEDSVTTTEVGGELESAAKVTRSLG